MPFSSRG